MTEAAAPADELEVLLDPAIARGSYANLVFVSRSRTEITLDFAYVQPEDRAVVQARVILALPSAHELVGLLTQQLALEFEDPAGG